jgi:hypothetical protein
MLDNHTRARAAEAYSVSTCTATLDYQLAAALQIVLVVETGRAADVPCRQAE